MKELMQKRIFHSSIELAPDRFYLLLGPRFALSKFNNFAREIDRDGNLLTAQERGIIYHGFEGFLPQLQTAMIQQFGAEIGTERITQFFSHFNLQRVLVVKADRFSQITHEDDQYVGTYRNSYGGVIFIKEIPPSQQPNPERRQEQYNRVLLEEALHMFLMKVDLPITAKLLKIAYVILHGTKAYDYQDEPQEHIVAAMIERLNPILFPQSHEHENSADVARGNGLIARVGWKFILEGRY